ncbi:MAG: hypothetical protein WAO69_06105 [Aestuariivita sp.]|uniref:hypothetical protein n=1 Tax=Aestuariivita sp. TaxID=1872407 RepID=UPI003BAE3A60
MDFAKTPDYDNITTLGVEWQTGFGAAKNVTVFADASTGSNDHDRITVGFRMYFGGGSKPLADRHRRDDPMRNITMDIVNTLSGPANGAGNNGQYGGAMQEVALGEECRINDVLCQYFANLQMGGNQMGQMGQYGIQLRDPT